MRAIGRIEKLCGEFPITSVEDALGEDDSEGWIRLTERLGKKIALVGDDLFVTNPKRLLQGDTERYRQRSAREAQSDRNVDGDDAGYTHSA